MPEVVAVIRDEDEGEDLLIIIPDQPRLDQRAVVAQVHHRRDERLKRQILSYLRGESRLTSEIAAHIHRSVAWTRQALRGLRVTEIEEDLWQLDDEVEEEE